MTGRRSSIVLTGLVALVVAACAGGPLLANAPASLLPEPVTSQRPPATADPVAIRLPGDDASHQRLTEWWYYTGHLRDVASGARYGFEYVIFRAERGGFPVSWAAHLAITDEGRQTFHYAQRSVIGRTAELAPGPGAGFSFSLGADPGDPTTAGRPAWTMKGVGGDDHLAARLSTAEAVVAGSAGGLGLDLSLHAAKPAVLQGGAGWIDFGPAGGSYYYSRTDLQATGSIVLDGRTLQVSGTAWFDHQWGDFIAVGGGGWDWFAVNLGDGSDLTMSLVRAADGTDSLVYGTFVDRDGRATHLDRSAFRVEITGRWTSPKTGASYPAGWTVTIPGQGLTLHLQPTVAGQELDTRATTGVVYWEGSQVVAGVHDGQAIGGEGYVELTGYGPGG